MHVKRAKQKKEMGKKIDPAIGEEMDQLEVYTSLQRRLFSTKEKYIFSQ